MLVIPVHHITFSSSQFHVGVAKIVLTKCLSKRKTKASHGQDESGPVKQVVYDYEFIEDYYEPKKTRPSASSALTPGIPLSPVTSQTSSTATMNEKLWWLVEDECEESDCDGTQEEEHCDPPCWGPKKYFSLYHPLSVMVGQP